MMAGNSRFVGAGAQVLAWAQGRKFVEPKAFPIYIVMAALVAVVAFALTALGFDYDPVFVQDYIIAAGIFSSIAMAARWVGFGRLAGTLEASILLLTVSLLTAMCAFIAASANRPCIDDILAHIDLLTFGFSRSLVVNMPHEWPKIYAFFRECYNTLSPQPFLLIAILFWKKDEDAAWTVLLAWTFALILCLIVSPFAPAYGTPPYVLKWIEIFDGARSGELRTLNDAVLTGIITFPSFHAAGAAVLAWGYWGVRYIRAPMITLNVLVIISAVLVGGHYIIDLIAGLGVAILAVYLARKSATHWPRSSSRRARQPA